MSSYYLGALFSKYTAGGCFFPNAERSSCRNGPSGEDCGFAWPVHVQRLFFFVFLVGFITSILQCTTAHNFPPVFTPGYGLIQDAHRNLCDRSRDPNLATGQANPHLPLEESMRSVFFLLCCYLTTLVAF